jgi:hypothetical protein
MLNGQLQLTDMKLGASMTRLRRPLFAVGVLSLAILAGCASKGTRAPVVDMTGGQPSSAVMSQHLTYMSLEFSRTTSGRRTMSAGISCP